VTFGEGFVYRELSSTIPRRSALSTPTRERRSAPVPSPQPLWPVGCSIGFAKVLLAARSAVDSAGVEPRARPMRNISGRTSARRFAMIPRAACSIAASPGPPRPLRRQGVRQTPRQDRIAQLDPPSAKMSPVRCARVVPTAVRLAARPPPFKAIRRPPDIDHHSCRYLSQSLPLATLSVFSFNAAREARLHSSTQRELAVSLSRSSFIPDVAARVLCAAKPLRPKDAQRLRSGDPLSSAEAHTDLLLMWKSRRSRAAALDGFARFDVSPK